MKIKETTPLASREYTLVLSQDEIELLWVATRFVSPESREDGAELETVRTSLAPHLRPKEERAYESVLVNVNRLLRKVSK